MGLTRFPGKVLALARRKPIDHLLARTCGGVAGRRLTAPERGTVGGFDLRVWVDPDALRGEAYAEYWNDEGREREKEWWVLDAGWERMERYLAESGLAAQLESALARAEAARGRGLRGAGADLAAGTLWAVPYLLKGGEVDRVYAVEYSEHRLTRLGPEVLCHYGVASESVVLCLGSFYDLRIEDGELDFVLLAQVLHHADDPKLLLREVRRVLRADGVVIVIGEHPLEEKMGRRRYVARTRRLVEGRVTAWAGRLLLAAAGAPREPCVET